MTQPAQCRPQCQLPAGLSDFTGHVDLGVELVKELGGAGEPMSDRRS